MGSVRSASGGSRRRRASGTDVRAARAGTPAPAAAPVLAALRRGRVALTEIEGDLDGVLDWLEDPSQPLDTGIPDRLAGRTREVSEALDTVWDLRAAAAHALF